MLDLLAFPDHLPPQSLDAEQSCLGAALISRIAAEHVLERLRHEDFYLEGHRRIFAVLAHLAEQDAPTDVMTVPEELRRRGQLDGVGGVSYIHTLVETVPTAAHVEYYARLVAEKSTLRQLIEVSHDIIGLAHAQDEELPEILLQAEARLAEVARPRGKAVVETLVSIVTDRVNLAGQPLTHGVSGIPTGFSRLDEITAGWQSGEMTGLMGTPGAGKTAFMLREVIECSGAKLGCGLFSIEMGKAQMGDRFATIVSGIEGQRLRHHRLTDADMDALGRATGQISEYERFLRIDYRSDIDLYGIRAQCREWLRSGPLHFVCVDYLQKIRGKARPESRNQELAAIARGCKNLAKDLNIHVLLISSMNRPAKGMALKPPTLQDFRDCGEIEYELDNALGLFRPKDGDRDGSVAELHILKQRNGPSDEPPVMLQYEAKCMRFHELDLHHTDADAPPEPARLGQDYERNGWRGA